MLQTPIQKPRRGAKRLKKIVFLFFLISTFGILGLETVLVFSWPNFRSIIEFAPEVGFRLKPTSAAIDYSTLAKDHRLVNYFVGTLGERAPDEDHKTPPADRLILCVGDSNTFGQGVEYEETYPALLSKRLGRDVSVINFGVPGYNGFQILTYCKSLVDSLGPDLVVFQISENDDDPALPIAELREKPLVSASRVSAFSYMFFRGVFQKNAPPEKTTIVALGEIAEFLKTRRIPLIVLVVSEPESTRAADLQSHLEGAYSCDVEHLRVPNNLLKSSRHFNRTGNERVADSLERLIRVVLTPF